MLKRITNERDYELKIVIEDTFGVEKQCGFDSFKIGTEAQKFNLQIDGFTEVPGMEPGDSLSVLNGNSFSTKDWDNDPDPSRNTAENLKGAGWYALFFIEFLLFSILN